MGKMGENTKKICRYNINRNLLFLKRKRKKEKRRLAQSQSTFKKNIYLYLYLYFFILSIFLKNMWLLEAVNKTQFTIVKVYTEYLNTVDKKKHNK